MKHRLCTSLKWMSFPSTWAKVTPHYSSLLPTILGVTSMSEELEQLNVKYTSTRNRSILTTILYSHSKRASFCCLSLVYPYLGDAQSINDKLLPHCIVRVFCLFTFHHHMTEQNTLYFLPPSVWGTRFESETADVHHHHLYPISLLAVKIWRQITEMSINCEWICSNKWIWIYPHASSFFHFNIQTYHNIVL